ncbi:MAG: hypothetical protein GY935_11020 [Gammaproteobacteria bacterium]|nr:hypothetical protein [Gammaproteobacteria bacterium]
MKLSKASNESPAEKEKLRNFDLTVEEIRILKRIKELTQSLEVIDGNSAQTVREEFFRCEIRRLQDQLEEIRENTLIR